MDRHPRRVNQGFTLLELLTVIATIAILAAIGVPNFLEAQTRAKLARARQDMAATAVGLAAYYADYQAYPPNHRDIQRFYQHCAEHPVVDYVKLKTPADSRLPWPEGERRGYVPFTTEPSAWQDVKAYTPLDSGRPHWLVVTRSGYDLRVLSTPIAYTGGTTMYGDPFADTRGVPLMYVNLSVLDAPKSVRNLRYYVMSYGPDVDESTGGGLPASSTWYDRYPPRNPILGAYIQYDPTNGTVSFGNLYRFGNDQVPPQELLVPSKESVEATPPMTARPGGF